MIAECDRIHEILHLPCMFGESGNRESPCRTAERDDEVIVVDFANLIARRHTVEDRLHARIDKLNLAGMEVGLAQEWPQRNHRMTRLDSTRAGFDEEWIKDEVVLPVDQINLV